MLAVERPLLNMLGRLSGIASLTRRYVDAVAGTRAGIYDTRKTTPGWRSLEKYAVRCGGGRNHRAGLFEAVLIKDNHLALGAELRPQGSRRLLGRPRPCSRRGSSLCERWGDAGRQMIVEIEVDTLEQFDEVLAVGPDLVLLDNMSPAMLREAVARRNARVRRSSLRHPAASTWARSAAVAETGVERISVGALTHSAAVARFRPGLGSPGLIRRRVRGARNSPKWCVARTGFPGTGVANVSAPCVTHHFPVAVRFTHPTDCE